MKKDPRQIINEDTGDSVVPQGKGVRWVDYMWELTPVEQKSDGMWYKREDKFALYGINSLNGSKCRQLLHLFETRPKNVKTVIHATNVNASPQTPMTAAMADHYGLRCIQVAGGSSYESLSKLPLPLFATMLGTEYDVECRSGFNVGIQKRVRTLMEDFEDVFTIERDITLDHKLEQNTPEMIKAFHEVGAKQVENIPDHITDMIIPFGSANSGTSIMYGLSKHKPKNLKRIHLVNVGVDKRQYMFERLEIMGADISDYDIVWHESGYEYSKQIKGKRVDDITFHYRYEAKAYTHIIDNHPDLINENTLFWIIGSVPDLETTAKNLGKEIPTEVTQYIHQKGVDYEDLEEKQDKGILDEWMEIFPEPIPFEIPKSDRKPTMYYVKGGNGAGKSTIPNKLMELEYEPKKIRSKAYNKVIFTVFPTAKLISLGNYEKGKTFGGCDGLVKEEIMYTLNILFSHPEYKEYDIYLEGSMTSDTIETYFELMKSVDSHEPVVLFLSTTYDQALDRIQARTGKTDEEMAQLKNVEAKYIRIERAKKAYREQIPAEHLDIKLLELNTEGTIDEVFERFIRREFDDITHGDICHA